MGRRKLLVVSHDYSLTGAPIALFNVLLGLRETWDIQVVAPADGALRGELVNADIKASVAPNVLGDVASVSELLAARDALISNTLLGCIPVHAAHRIGKPSVWYIHEGKVGLEFIKQFGPAMSGAIPLASRLVLPCQFAADQYRPWRGDRATEIVPYGVANHELPAPPADEARIHVLQMGSIEARKGQDIALTAMRQLNDERFLLHFVGNVMDPNYHQQIQSLFADVRNVRYWMGVPKERAVTMMADCDMLIVPSRDEVTPMVILEAMSLGKPVIAAKICGIPEMIEDGKTGFLFESENHQQLADLMRRLGKDKELRRSVGTRAWEFQRSHRTLEQCTAGFERVLGEVAK